MSTTAIPEFSPADLALLTPAEQAELERHLRAEAGITTPMHGDWDWLCRAVWTRDEASGRIRQFPGNDPAYAYLQYLTAERGKCRIRAYDKSRRMLITWWLLALYLYRVMTRPNQLLAVASDKLEKSAYLLGTDRMEAIYRLIPPVTDAGTLNALNAFGLDLAPFRAQVWPNKPLLTFEGKQGKGWKLVTCSRTGSSIMAVASGESQMQQYTFSSVLMDEFPRWQWQEESWRNIQPTTQGGGEVDIVCTPELGTFAQSLLFDEEVS